MSAIMLLQSVFITLVALSPATGWLFSSTDPFEDNLTKFELYTRKNSDTFESGTGQNFGKIKQIVKDSNFDGSKQTKFFLHGWLGAGWNWYIRDMRREMLKNEDCNFVEVDWSDGSVTPNYLAAMRSAQQAGRETADLIKWLHDNFGLDYYNVHLIGHSLGAQAAGAAGGEFTGAKLGRITGLDPAQPGFNLSDVSDTLDPSDADFVDCIHTTLVSTSPMGHVDFYPNGGSLGIPFLTWIHSHLTPLYIFTESINSQCTYTAYKCSSYELLMSGGCSTSCAKDDQCNRMGYHASPDGALGSLQLHIKEYAPYC